MTVPSDRSLATTTTMMHHHDHGFFGAGSGSCSDCMAKIRRLRRRLRFVILLVTIIAAMVAFAVLSSIHAIDNIVKINDHGNDFLDTSHYRHTRSMEEVLSIMSLPNARNETIIPIDTQQQQQQQRRQLLLDQCPDHILRAPPSQLQIIQQQPVSVSSTSTPLFYAASFPGSGDKLITKHLVEQLTGLHVGEAVSSDRGGGRMIDATSNTESGDNIMHTRVVAVRTQYPHTSGQLASFDRDINRAIVLLRNPLHAIPNYFDRIYELKNHLPTGSSSSSSSASSSSSEQTEAAAAAAAREAWIEWRDAQLSSQLMLYRRFVSYWMDRHAGAGEKDRLYFSYESLVNEESGPGEAVRLAMFLEKGIRESAVEWAKHQLDSNDGEEEEEETTNAKLLGGTTAETNTTEEIIDRAAKDATASMAAVNDLPCIWKEIVYSTLLSSKKLDDDGEWNSVERPFTAENLAEMTNMLLELLNRWSRHQRVLTILSVYHRTVNREYLAATGALEEALSEHDKALQGQQQQQQVQHEQQPPPPPPQGEAPQPPPLSVLPFRVIQASHPNTASTVATNWLIGLFEPQKDVAFMKNNWPMEPIQQSGKDTTIDANIVVKTHNLDLLTLYKLIRPSVEEVFFVVSYRNDDAHSDDITDDLCSYKNVLCIEYEELLYNNEEELHGMVKVLTDKFRKRFKYYFGTDSTWLQLENELNAVERLDATARAAAAMANEPADKVDLKFGVHGGYQSEISKVVDPNGDSDGDKIMPYDRLRGRRRRRLSIALPGGGCEITWPQPAQNVQTSYAASYPGCGARMTWNLIEALTGLWTGDDWDNNRRGKQVVTVKTHYPHDAGQLVSWDSEITRAIVIIRNPMNSIPSFFNHIYETQNNLPIHSQRAPVNDWIIWRDSSALSQIKKFAKFIDYWMERFDNVNDDRIFISYETLTDDNKGPDEAIRLNNFLSGSEGVHPISTESVPCVWRAVVKYKEQVKPSNPKLEGEKRRRLDPAHHDSQRSGPTERPYTQALLESMSNMLVELIQKWGDRHLHLRSILEGYQQEVHASILNIINQSSQSIGIKQPTKLFHIFQASLPHTGTTVLNNILVGLFDPTAAYKKSSLVTITHDMNLLELYKRERHNFDEIFFVVTIKGEDPNTQIDNELCNYDNVLCIDSGELKYTSHDELNAMVNSVADRFQSRFQYFFGPASLDESKRADAVKRIKAMETATAALDQSQGASDATNDGLDEPTQFSVNGKSFHIFQASPPHTASTIVTNWLMGLFEPEQNYSFLVNDGSLKNIRHSDRTVPINTTVITKTHVLDLMKLYTKYKPEFDGEIFFVVSNRGTSTETRIDPSYCQYDNVLCIEYEELQFESKEEVKMVVNNLTNKFRARFEYFFGANSDFFSEARVATAVQRLYEMNEATAALENDPFEKTDIKFGVHGGHRNREGTKKLYYCGGAQGFLSTRQNFRYSTFGLFLAKPLFPDFEGTISIDAGGVVENSVLPLTDETIKQATDEDLLIVHSHQFCAVDVEAFPGYQLHINAEYYDIHPSHRDNINGKLTYDYLPPGDWTFVIGPHEDTAHSIRVPLCSMRLWFLHMSGQTELSRIFEPMNKPKNTREHFLLYINSHYIEYRERAARALSEIATIHTAGKCQGNFEANPAPSSEGSPAQCVPFDDSQRPSSILPISGHSGADSQRDNLDIYSKYRYALVMENTDAPGYVSEKILHAFLAGAIPIYFGSRLVFDIFNAEAFIFFDLDAPQQALSQIQFYEQNPARYEEMLNAPILAHGEETIEKYFSWDETVGSGVLKSRIRKMMGLS